MNQTQAIRKLKPIIGKKLAWRIDANAPDADERERRHAAHREARRLAEETEAARIARRDQLLGQDAEYQALKAAADRAHKAKGALPGFHDKRIKVGRDHGWCFSVVADGDNWDEVVALVISKEAVQS